MDSEPVSDVGECYTAGGFARDAQKAANVMAIGEDETGKMKDQEEDLGAKFARDCEAAAVQRHGHGMAGVQVQ
eukprot:7327909-Heterocapsa_arctica.AAC.1